MLEVHAQAQAADATYAAARATWAAAQERVPQARAGLLPLASVSASAQYNDRSTRFRDPALPRTNADFASSSVTLSVTQPIWRQGNLIAYLAQSKDTYMLSLLRLEAAIGELTVEDLAAVNQWLAPAAAK